MEKKSKQTLDVAKLMAVNTILTEKVAETVTGENCYPKLNEIVCDIIEAKPFLEKTAFDLMQLKAQQYTNRKEVINQTIFKQLLSNLITCIK